MSKSISSRQAPGIIIALFMLAVAHVVAGQELNNKVTSPATAPVITGSVSAERLRFTAPGSVVQMQLQIYTESGQLLFDVTSKGNVLDWTLQDRSGEQLVPGSYLCVVTVKSLSGKLTQRIGSALLQEKQIKLQRIEPAQFTLAQQQAVGPIEENGALTILDADEVQATTVLANNGTEGQMIRGRGALSFRLGDFFSGRDQEQMRLTEEGNLGIGTSAPKSKLDVAGAIRAERFLITKPNKSGGDKTNVDTPEMDSSNSVQPLIGGSGTTGQLTKWTDGANGTLGDSEITQTAAGNIGLGTTTPGAKFHVMGVQGQIGAGAFQLDTTTSFSSWQSAFPAFEVLNTNLTNNNISLFQFSDAPSGAAHAGIGAVSTNHANKFGDLFFFTKGADGYQLRMGVYGGNVGIGTTTPASKLEVNGGYLTVGSSATNKINVDADATGAYLQSSGTSPLRFYSGNTEAIRILNSGNVGIGNTSPTSKLDVAGDINTSTGFNLAGNRVLSVTGAFFPSNTFAGVGAGAATTPALFEDDGNNNSFFGFAAGTANTTGWRNSFFGAYAGAANTFGINNSFFGDSAGVFNTGGILNSFFGSGAGASNANGQSNSFVGVQAGFSSTGSGNSFVGRWAGYANESGNNNSFLGTEAGRANTTGSNNTIIGQGANLGAGNLNNATALGSGAIVSQSNSLVLGNGANVGIGTTAPVSVLHLNGNHNDFALTFTNQSNTAGVRGYRIAFDSDRLTFQSANDSGAFAANQMTIDPATGNLGLGTTAPSFKLHINDQSNTGLRVQNGTPGGTVAGFGGFGAFQIDTTTTSGGRFTVKENGNTGIGTNNPNAKLQVVGGNVYIANPNSLIITSPNGTCWLVTVSNTGTLSSIATPCP